MRKAILLGVRSNIGREVKQYSFVAPLQALVATEGWKRAESVRVGSLGNLAPGRSLVVDFVETTAEDVVLRELEVGVANV